VLAVIRIVKLLCICGNSGKTVSGRKQIKRTALEKIPYTKNGRIRQMRIGMMM
jgi:hypothetical protein